MRRGLSEQEHKVVAMAAKGATDEAIAAKLGIALTTVRGYWGRIQVKLGGCGRGEFIARWMKERCDEELARLELEHKNEMVALRNENQTELTDLRSEHDGEMARMAEAHAVEITTLHDGFRSSMDDERAAHDRLGIDQTAKQSKDILKLRTATDKAMIDARTPIFNGDPSED